MYNPSNPNTYSPVEYSAALLRTDFFSKTCSLRKVSKLHPIRGSLFPAKTDGVCRERNVKRKEENNPQPSEKECGLEGRQGRISSDLEMCRPLGRSRVKITSGFAASTLPSPPLFLLTLE